MTNPAEKIRQVVEDATDSINENESYFSDREAANSHVRHIFTPVLDAIIEEMEEEYIYLTEACMVSPPEQDKHSGYLACLRNKIEQLKEARSELLQQQ